MARHFVYRLIGDEPDPIGAGDTRSWFYYYKVDQDGEVWLAWMEEVAPSAGDWLWILLDGLLVGVAKILRMMDDPLNNRKEVWYDTKNLVLFPTAAAYGADEELEEFSRLLRDAKNPVPEELVSQWQMILQPPAMLN